MGSQSKSYLSTKSLILYDLARLEKFLNSIKTNKAAKFLTEIDSSRPLAEMQIIDFENIYADKQHHEAITHAIIELIQINPHIREIYINNDKNIISKANLKKLQNALAQRAYINVFGLQDVRHVNPPPAIEISSSSKSTDMSKWRNLNSYELLEEDIDFTKSPASALDSKRSQLGEKMPIPSVELLLKNIKAACNIHVKFLSDIVETTIANSPSAHLFNQFHGAILVNKVLEVLARPKPSMVSALLDDNHFNIALNRYEIMKKLIHVLNDSALDSQQKIMRFHQLISNITLPRLLQQDFTEDMEFNDAVLQVHQFVQMKKSGAPSPFFPGKPTAKEQLTTPPPKKSLK